MKNTAIIFLLSTLGVPAAAQSLGETSQQVGKSAENIVTKPLKDANVVKTEIPPVLLAIMDNPYSLQGLSTCAQFSAEISKLTAVLGPDVDAVKPKTNSSASEMVLSELENTAGRLIPGSGLIRKVSGAEAQQNKAKAAVYAGALRRAYLKGTARGKGCKV